MSTTTIRLPDELKSRIAKAAERSGMTAHSFILEALAEKADQEERQGDFRETTEARYENIVVTGKTIAWKDMRHYLEERSAGRKAGRPVARKLSR